jgi:hypothetical protein
MLEIRVVRISEREAVGTDHGGELRFKTVIATWRWWRGLRPVDRRHPPATESRSMT